MPTTPPQQLSLARTPLLQGRVPLPLLDAALLCWLALEGPTPRARIAALLWPDSDTEAARNSLRQRLFKLRRLCDAELVSGSTTLALATGVTHDLDAADSVLGGEAVAVGAEFDAWLEQQRQRRRSRVHQSLAALCESAEASGDWAGALAHAQELLAQAPTSEEAHRRVMRLHYLAGDRSAALLAFDRCEQVLKHEIGARPSPETLALLHTVEQAQAAPASAPAAGRRVPASVLRPPRLVGRAEAWSALQGAWDDGCLALVSGEGGLGKSRLATDFAAAQGTVVVAGARPGDDRSAYASFSRLLRQLPRPLLAALALPLRRELARLLPELGDAPPPLQGGAARTRFFNAVAALFGDAGPVAGGVLFDDLHLADEASLELLQFVVAASPRRWLVTARVAEAPAPVQRVVGQWLAQPDTREVALLPLTLAQVAELVDSLDIPGLRGAEAAPALLRRTGGNPMYLLEAVKAGALPGTGTLPALPGVHALIERRISRLSVPAVQLARCAAVAAPDFSIELAAHVLQLRTIDLADPWAELEAAQVLVDGAFAHDLIYEAALASVPAPVARQLHAEIAAFLAAHGSPAGRLAHHWWLAGRWPQAAAAQLQAAQQAGDGGRSGEQAQWLAQAADALGRSGDAPGRFNALLQRAEVMAANDGGAPALAAVAALTEAAADDRQRLQALGVRLELAVARFEIDEALQLAPQAVRAAAALGERDLELRFAIVWSGALGDARRMAEGVQVLEPHAEWVDAQGTPEQAWVFWEAYALALDYAGRLRDSQRGWQTCQALARTAQRSDQLWRSMSNAAAGQAKMGRVRQACELSLQARQLALAGGEVGRMRLLQMQAPHAHRLRDVGRYAEALPLLEEALAGFLAEGSATDVTMTEQRLALLFLFLGQPGRAAPLLAAQRDAVPPGVVMFGAVLRAEVASQIGGDALTPLRGALALVANPDDVFHRIATLFASHIVPADEGEAMASSLAIWATRQERLGLAMSAHVRAARRAADQRAWQRALPHAEAALDLVREHQPESFYLGELWLQAGRVYRGLGRDAAAQQVFADGAAWVRGLHDSHVPPPFRDSFLHRNPVNAALLAAAAAR